jgi:hypothetical protein
VFHVVTVHWKQATWIEPQLRYLRRFLPSDTRVYAALNGIDSPLTSEFAYAADLPGRHPEKLNTLAQIVSEHAAPDDYLVFIDGDAFPIAPITPALLGDTPLAAVRRDENLGDPQPHPCFCVTTVGFWNEIGGDWRPGYTWKNTLGYRISDVGGNLLGILRAHSRPWHPLLRSNEVDLHHLWFAIYGDVVYHHGAGFRGRRARAALDMRRAWSPTWLPVVRRLDKHLATRAAIRRRINSGPQLIAKEQAISDAVVAAIQADEPFVDRFFTRHAGPEAVEGETG